MRAQTAALKNGSKFFTIVKDEPNMRVTMKWGTIGTNGRKLVRKFDSRIATREYADRKLNSRVSLGFA